MYQGDTWTFGRPTLLEDQGDDEYDTPEEEEQVARDGLLLLEDEQVLSTDTSQSRDEFGQFPVNQQSVSWDMSARPSGS